MAMEPQTGEIKAWVGGINYKYFQYDHVGQGARQVGSTFKPLYTLPLSNN
jgi:penicillin-binding protein 1A